MLFRERIRPSLDTEPGQQIVKSLGIEAQTKEAIAELLELFTDIPAVAWSGRQKHHLPKYNYELKVIADTQDRRERTNASLDSGPGVTMISLLPTPDYKNSLSAIHEFYYRSVASANRRSTEEVLIHIKMRFDPGKEEPVIENTFDWQAITPEWWDDLNYPPGHALDVIKKITKVAKLKKEENNKT